MRRFHGKLTSEEKKQALAFAQRLAKFRDSLIPGMTLRVHEHTGDAAIDGKVILARVKQVYENWVLLEDDKGKKYGPTLFNLLAWGND